jgi:hypothetical protein
LIFLNFIFFLLNFVFKIIVPFKLFLFFMFSCLIICQIWLAYVYFIIESIWAWINWLDLFKRCNFGLNIHIPSGNLFFRLNEF